MPVTRYILQHDAAGDYLIFEERGVVEIGRADAVARCFTGRSYRTPDRDAATRFPSALEAELAAFTHRPADAHLWRWECVS